MTQIDLSKRLACSDSWLGRLRKHVESGCEHLEGWLSKRWWFFGSSSKNEVGGKYSDSGVVFKVRVAC